MKKKILAMILAISTIMSYACIVKADTMSVKKVPDEINLITSHQQNDATVLNLSWTNPDYTISAIEVTEPLLGTVSAGKTISLEAGATNFIQLTGLTEGQLYTFTVNITKEDGSVESYTTTGLANSIDLERNTEEEYGTVWHFKYENRNSQGGRFIDSATKNSGQSSLKIVANGGDYIGMLSEDDNTIKFTEGYTYEFSFYTKNLLKSGVIKWTDNYDGTFNASPSYEWKKNTYTIKNVRKNEDDTWSYTVVGIDGIEVENTADSRFNPRIVVDGTGVVWIDDIELYITDTEGNKTSNVYKNGEFESSQSYYGTSNVSAIGENASATISWTNPKGTITEAVVVDENLDTVATGVTTSQGANSITISELTNQKLYNYYIRIVVNGVTQYIPVSVVPRNNSSAPYTTYDGYTLSGFSNWGWNDARVKVTLDTENKYAGNSSLHINFASGSWGGLSPATKWGTITTGKNYRLSVWAKSSENSTGTLRIDNTDGAKYIDIPEKTTEWTQFTYDFNATLNGLVHRIDEVVPCTGDWWIDELEIYEIDEIGGNVIGGNVYKDLDYSFDAAGATKILAVPASTSATLSWKNPVNAGITDVYLVDNGYSIVVKNLSTTSGGMVSATVNGLVSGENYTYYAMIKVANGKTVRVPISFTADENKPFAATMYTYGEQEYLTEVRQTRDTEVKYSGNSSLKLQSNFINGWSSVVIPCENLNTESKYEISFMYKSEGASGSLWTSDDWHTRTALTLNSDWKKATVVWKGSDIARIRLGLEGAFDALWIDDVIVREIDEEGNYVSGNLLSDGGFELTTNKVLKNEVTENGAAITLYNGYGLDCYAASYDASGNLVDVKKMSADNSGGLVQTFDIDVEPGATIKSFVWNDMVPVK